MKLSTVALIVVTSAILGSARTAQNRRRPLVVPQQEIATPATPVATGPVNFASVGQWGLDLTDWNFWWEFNKEPYLALKAHVHDDRGEGEGSYLGRCGSGDPGLRPTETQIRTKIVPALKHALATERDVDIVTACLIALAKIGNSGGGQGGSELVPLVLPYLAHEDAEVAEVAATALGIVGHPEAIPPLVALLRDDAAGRQLVHRGPVGKRVRSFAGYSLGLVGAATSSEPVRQRIVRALMARLRGSESKGVDIDTSCAIALGLVPLTNTNARTGLTRVDQLDFLFTLLRDPTRHPHVRAHTVTSLARLLEGMPAHQRAWAKQRLGETLLETVGSCASVAGTEREPVVRSAVLALGIIGDADEDVMDRSIRSLLLTAARRSDDMATQRFALLSLARVSSRLGEAGYVPGLEYAAQPAVDLLQGWVEGADRGRGRWAALSLGVLERSLQRAGIPSPTRDRSLATLRGALAKQSRRAESGALAIGLALADDVEGTEVVLQAFDRAQDSEARGYIAIALGMLNEPSAIEPIARALRKAKYRPEFLQQTAIASALLGNKEVVPTLIGMLAEAKGLATQAALSSGLGFIGDRRAVDALVAMLATEDISECARAFAAVSLGLVADKEALPWNARIGQDLNYLNAPYTLNDLEGTGVLNVL